MNEMLGRAIAETLVRQRADLDWMYRALEKAHESVATLPERIITLKANVAETEALLGDDLERFVEDYRLGR